jgi:hypothetical protein
VKITANNTMDEKNITGWEENNKQGYNWTITIGMKQSSIRMCGYNNRGRHNKYNSMCMYIIINQSYINILISLEWSLCNSTDLLSNPEPGCQNVSLECPRMWASLLGPFDGRPASISSFCSAFPLEAQVEVCKFREIHLDAWWKGMTLIAYPSYKMAFLRAWLSCTSRYGSS